MPRIHGVQQTSWWGSTVPPTFVSLSAATYIGVGVSFDAPGRIAGVRLYVPGGVTQFLWAIIWSFTAGSTLRLVPMHLASDSPANEWLQAWFRPWLRVDTTSVYRVAVLCVSGYQRQNSALTSSVVHNSIRFLSSFQTTSINPVGASITSNTNANGVDILFNPD